MDSILEARIRKPAPVGSSALAGSTPVVAFGDFQCASAATLGLNPSKREFLNRYGGFLHGEDTRFETLFSLEVTSLSDAPTPAVSRVADGCKSYFHRNPYRLWFNPLDEMLKGCGASYFNGSACHLDLAHWATDPTWGDLPRQAREQLIDDGLDFLKWQLQSHSIRLLLLNGRSVINAFCDAFHPMKAVGRIPGPRGAPTTIFCADIWNDLRVIGWSTNLQSSHGVTRAFRFQLCEQISALAAAQHAA